MGHLLECSTWECSCSPRLETPGCALDGPCGHWHRHDGACQFGHDADSSGNGEGIDHVVVAVAAAADVAAAAIDDDQGRLEMTLEGMSSWAVRVHILRLISVETEQNHCPVRTIHQRYQVAIRAGNPLVSNPLVSNPSNFLRPDGPPRYAVDESVASVVAAAVVAVEKVGLSLLSFDCHFPIQANQVPMTRPSNDDYDDDHQ